MKPSGPARRELWIFGDLAATSIRHWHVPTASLCSPDEPLGGGTYGARLNELLRQFTPRFFSVLSVLAFPLSLSPEELTQVLFPALP